MFYNNPAKTTSVFVRNNIFYQTNRDRECCIDLHNDWSSSLTLDHNCYYQASGEMIRWVSDRYTMAQFPAYQAKTGKDGGSITADPRFADVAHQDFRPAADSPVCRLANGSFTGALPCVESPSR